MSCKACELTIKENFRAKKISRSMNKIREVITEAKVFR